MFIDCFSSKCISLMRLFNQFWNYLVLDANQNQNFRVFTSTFQLIQTGDMASCEHIHEIGARRLSEISELGAYPRLLCG